MAATKVTLTLQEELLSVVDRYVDDHPGQTRSGVCAAALRAWLQARQEEEIAAYYQSLSDEERAENASWGNVAAAGAASLWR